MQLRYDLNVGALYIRLTGQAVARTVEIDDNTFVDLDDGGNVAGIEVISIAHRWALGDILRDYSIADADGAQLRAYFQPSTHEIPAVGIERTPPVNVAA